MTASRPLRAQLLAIAAVLLVLAVLAGVVVVARFDPAAPGFPISLPCTFRNLTGLLCPGCGGTRGMHRLLNGDVLGALRFNPLTFALLPFIAWAGLAMLVQVWSPWRLPLYRPRAWMITTLVVVLVAFGVLRNLPGQAFAWLRPPVPVVAADVPSTAGAGCRAPACDGCTPTARPWQ